MRPILQFCQHTRDTLRMRLNASLEEGIRAPASCIPLHSILVISAFENHKRAFLAGRFARRKRPMKSREKPLIELNKGGLYTAFLYRPFSNPFAEFPHDLLTHLVRNVTL